MLQLDVLCSGIPEILKGGILDAAPVVGMQIGHRNDQSFLARRDRLEEIKDRHGGLILRDHKGVGKDHGTIAADEMVNDHGMRDDTTLGKTNKEPAQSRSGVKRGEFFPAEKILVLEKMATDPLGLREKGLSDRKTERRFR